MINKLQQEEVIIPALLGRVSSEDQHNRQTIQNQIDFGLKYCDLHSLPKPIMYLDDGITGTIPLEERPAGKQLLEDAKAKKFNLLLIYKLDRLGRSARIILNAVHELEQLGVKIRSMTEPFDTGDPSGRFLLTILAGVADLEHDTILERMWHGANRAARAGKWLGGIVPYGYNVKDKYLEINEIKLSGMDMSEADIIRLIYHLTVDEEYSTVQIADYLNALHIPPSYIKDNRTVKSGKRKVRTSGIWLPSRIRNIISNPTYKGTHLYGKRTMKDREIIYRSVPAIISEEYWNNAIRILKEHQLEAVKNSRRRYLLRGLIKCGSCGLTYIGTAFSGAKRKLTPYYICNGKNSYRGIYFGKCISKNISAEWLESIVWQDCLEFITNPGEAIKELAASIDDKKSNQLRIEEEISNIEKNIQNTDNEKQKILDFYRKNFINSNDAESQLKSIMHERNLLDFRLKDLEKQLAVEQDLANQIDTAEELLLSLQESIQDNMSFELKREIVKTLVEKIIVFTNNEDGELRANISIYYKFAKVTSSTDNRTYFNLGQGIIKRVEMPWNNYTTFPENFIALTPAGRIRQTRLAKKMTIRKLAAAAKMSPEALSYIENEKTKPSLPRLRTLAQILDMTIAYLGCFEDLPEDTLGQKITKARLHLGMQKTEFARMIGVHVRSIWDWEKDVVKPYPKQMEKLKSFLEPFN
jgi:site-specific DNA recombinase